MLDEANLVREVHSDYIRSGARVITLNNYTATVFKSRTGALQMTGATKRDGVGLLGVAGAWKLP